MLTDFRTFTYLFLCLCV